MPPGWERDTAHETIGNSMVGDENSRPYFGEGVGRIHDQKTRSELSTMLNEFDTDDGFIEVGITFWKRIFKRETSTEL